MNLYTEEFWGQLEKDMSEGYLAVAERKNILELKDELFSKKTRVETLQEQNKDLLRRIKHYEPDTSLIDPLKRGVKRERTIFLIEKKFGSFHPLGLDSRFNLPSERDMRRIIREDWTDKKEYLAEVFDCENFSFLFQSRLAWYWKINSVGVVLNYNIHHAFNIFITQNGAYSFEPQTDKIDPNYKIANQLVLI